MNDHNGRILEIIYDELERFGEGNAFKRRTIRTLPEPTQYDIYCKYYGRFRSRLIQREDGKRIKFIKEYPEWYMKKYVEEAEKRRQKEVETEG